MAGKKSRSIFVIIFSSHAAIIIVFTIAMAALFLYSANTITKQTRQSDGFIADRTVQQADEMLENLYEHGEMLVQDYRLTAFSQLTPALQMMSGNEISKIMERANDFTSLTTELFFCPEGPDMIMSRTGLHTGADVEPVLQESLGISTEEWRERTAFTGVRSFQIVASTDAQGVRHRNLLMMVRRSEAGEAEPGCFVAGIVPIEFLNDLANAIRPEGYEDIIVEYPEGIYSFARQETLTREELEKTQEGNTDIFSLLFSGKPIHVTTSEGRIGDTPWKIHFFCPLAPYRNIVMVCLRNFIVPVLIVLVLGSILLYFTVSTQYRPLKILMDRLSGRQKESSPVLRGEFKEIDQAIGALQKKQQGTESQLEEYRTRLQETAVHQLLRGTGKREESLAGFFRAQELNLRSERCRVMLLALDADVKMNDLGEKEADDLLERLLEETKEFLYRCLPKSCCVIADDCVECLICSDDETNDAGILQFMKDNLMDYCREKGIHFYAAISDADTGTEGARRAFQQAETILDHATMTGYRDVILDELPEQRLSQAKSGQEIRQQQLVDYVNAHYTDASLSVLQLADMFDMSPSSVSRTFKQATDIGLNTYIHTLRVSRAKELMENTQDSLKHISEEVGYGNQITMIRAFKKMEGITPREYRDQIQGLA